MEIVIDFSKGKTLKASLPNIIMDGNIIERTESAKILGVHISSDLTWNTHVDHIVAKASKRLYMLYQVKRAGISQNDLLKIYVSVVRPILEYACPVWSTNLPNYLSHKIEMVQKRAMRAIYPGLSYDDILQKLGTTSLHERRTNICQKYFNNMKKREHRLNHLLPEPRSTQYNLRTMNELPVIKCRTSRFQNSFLPWALSNCQWFYLLFIWIFFFIIILVILFIDFINYLFLPCFTPVIVLHLALIFMSIQMCILIQQSFCCQ